MAARQAAPAAAGVFAELFRRSGTSLPRLKGKVLAATVVASRPDDKFVEVDVGFKSTVTLLRAELGAAGAAARPGDVHPVVVEHVETPLGEMALDAEKARDAERMEHVWQEIKDVHARGGLIKGRVLNAVNSGYAVGVAGMVCFLPSGRARQRNASVVGSLQPFEIIALNEATRNVVVGSAAEWRVAAASAAEQAAQRSAAAAAARARPAFDRSRISREGGVPRAVDADAAARGARRAPRASSRPRAAEGAEGDAAPAPAAEPAAEAGERKARRVVVSKKSAAAEGEAAAAAPAASAPASDASS